MIAICHITSLTQQVGAKGSEDGAVHLPRECLSNGATCASTGEHSLSAIRSGYARFQKHDVVTFKRREQVGLGISIRFCSALCQGWN